MPLIVFFTFNWKHFNIQYLYLYMRIIPVLFMIWYHAFWMHLLILWQHWVYTYYSIENLSVGTVYNNKDSLISSRSVPIIEPFCFAWLAQNRSFILWSAVQAKGPMMEQYSNRFRLRPNHSSANTTRCLQNSVDNEYRAISHYNSEEL